MPVARAVWPRAGEWPVTARVPAEESTPWLAVTCSAAPPGRRRAGVCAVDDGPPGSDRRYAWHAERSVAVLGVLPVLRG